MDRPSDRDLLFGLIAVRNGLIRIDELEPSNIDSTIADRLVESGVLPDRTAIDAMVETVLRLHDGDARSAIEAIDPDASTRELLAERAADDDATRSYAGSGDDRKTAPANESSGSGRYREVRLLGEGGLGIVHLARDGVLRRDVALKRIKNKRADNSAWRRRLRHEAELTGSLEHPGIVPVYDLGADIDGRPFYAMRHIDGEKLGVVASRYHANRDGLDPGSRSLELRRLLRCFLDACDAIDYAHGRGILHRDIKPDNILIGRHGESIVVDWGLAKAESGSAEASGPSDEWGRPPDDESSDTQPGSIFGTPAYMAPEQASGRPLGPSADIYSLGATLYRLLANRAAFKGTTELVLDAVRRGDFRPPRHHDPTIDPALDAICMKAMAFRPDDRYPTARALADDVERWLADEPITAYRDPWMVRLSRWARRHRTGVIAAGSTLAAVAASLAISTCLIWAEQRRANLGWREAEAQRDRAEKALVVADEQKTRAEQQAALADANFGLAWDMADDLNWIVNQNETGKGPTSESLKERRALLDRAMTASRNFLIARPDDPEMLERLARLLRYAANLARFINERDRPATLYAESIRLLEMLRDRSPDDPKARDRLAQALRDQGSFLRRIGKRAESDAVLDRSIASTEELVRTDPETFRWPLAIALIARSENEWGRERFDESANTARQAAGLIDEMVASGARSHYLSPLFHAMALMDLAMGLRDGDAPAIEVSDALDSAVAEFESLAKRDDSPDVMHNAAIARLERARNALKNPAKRVEALDDLGQAIARWRELAKYRSDVPRYREWLADALTTRARLRDDKAALDDLDESRRLLEGLVGSDQGDPNYRALLGENWAGRAKLTKEPAPRDQAVDRALSSFRAATARDAENPRWPRRIREISSEWPEAARASEAALERRRAGQKP